MERAVPFMHRDDWMEDGKPKFKEYCPVTPAEKNKRRSAIERRSVSGEFEENEAEQDSRCQTVKKAGSAPSALELQFDWDLHQMTGYMRRLDGEGLTKRKLKRMDPFARDNERKFAFDGSQTPYFGFWFYVAWYNVIVPALTKTFGPILSVVDQDDLDELLAAKVAM